MIIGLVFLFALAPQSNDVTTFYERPDYRLRLGDQVFDPLIRYPRMRQAKVEGGGDDFFLVQFQGAVRNSWVQELIAAGLQPVRYVHPFTYIVWGDPNALSQSSRSPHVRWSGAFESSFRLLPRYRNLADAPIGARLLAWRGVDATDLSLQLASLGATDIQVSTLGEEFHSLAFRIAGDQLGRVVALPGIYTVQPIPTDGGTRSEMSNQLLAGNMSQVLKEGEPVDVVDPGYLTWLSGLGLDGTGVVMANVDSGVDQEHPDLVNRFRPCVGESCDENGTLSSTHGSHTAGIMGGDAASGTMDTNGFLRGLGVAPAAEMIEQIYIGNYQGAEGMGLLIRESRENGALLSNNSWGPSGQAKGYDLNTMEVDMGVRDADPNTPGNQSFSFILAVANGFGGVSRQGTPDEAKNLFAVGSTYMQLNNSSGSLDPRWESISNNSAHGPCLDGRLLPHIVAPGRYVDSCSGNDGYTLLAGTSMAAPHVAGAAALFTQRYRNLSGSRSVAFDPSPEMVKAAFLAVTRDLFGANDADGDPLTHRFNNQQGWGRLDLSAILDPPSEPIYLDRPRVLQGTGEVWQSRFEVVDPAEPVQLMLAWTDAPGHGLGGEAPAWNNDLDLEVDYDGNTYAGNVFDSDGWSTPGGTADEKNNTEGVMLGPTATGEFVTRVIARQLTSDGIPGSGGLIDQDFALACYNCRQLPAFFLDLDTRRAALCAANAVDVAISVAASDGFADQVSLSLTGLPEGAMASFDSQDVLPGGGTTLHLTELGGLAPGEYPLTVSGTASGWEDSVSLILAVHTGVPAKVTLSAPLDQTTHQSLNPTFSWQEQPLTFSYLFEIGTTSDLAEPLYAVSTEGSSLNLPLDLSYGFTYYWRVTATNDCGRGEVVTSRSFSTIPSPDVLLVDDDNNSPNLRNVYHSVLDFWGVSYEDFDTFNSNIEPDATDLEGYKLVIWFSGEAVRNGFTGPRSGPSSQSEFNLANYLDKGGSLLLSAQSYFSDQGINQDQGDKEPIKVPNGFMTDYLGMETGSENVQYTQVLGSPPDLGGLGPYDLSFTLVDNRTSTMTSDGVSVPAFTAGEQTAGLLNGVGSREGTYRTLFLGFPLETINGTELRDLFPSLLGKLGLSVNSSCLNDTNFMAKLPFWPQEDVRGLVVCLNAFKVEKEADP
ncbi:MAG: S8 family serine peptidase [Acidobacteriota bacterium]|nr:S8 family serine peptidase [Acidobacteriota bacterium]